MCEVGLCAVSGDERRELLARGHGGGQINRIAENDKRRHQLMIEMHKAGMKSQAIAREFGVSDACVRMVVARHKRANGLPLTPGRAP
jgi:DNA invertase Pin-like site-specific DNA recombinase